MTTTSSPYLTADEYVQQSSIKWSAVIQALADLYTRHTTANDDYAAEVETLMQAYDEWLG